MAQTTVQKQSAIRFGSARFEVGPDIGSLVNLGVMRGITFEETWDEVIVKTDNGGELPARVKNHIAKLSGNLMEIDLANLNTIRGGMDNLTTVAGTLVSGASYTVTSGNWQFDKIIPLPGQNHDWAKITPTSVTGSVAGVLTVNTHYSIVKNAAGQWGIAIKNGAPITSETQNITIVYNYTPAASKSLSSGGKTAITPNVVKVTNVNSAGKELSITLYKASNSEGIKIEFPADDDDDPAMVPVVMRGSLDVNRAIGSQLFVIEDSQNV